MPPHKRIFMAGVAIAVAGLLSAALVYAFSADTAPTIELGDRRANEFQIERIGGKATVYVVRFNEWLGSLWHGRQLAFTIGIISIVIALVCFWIADREATRLPADQDHDRTH